MAAQDLWTLLMTPGATVPVSAATFAIGGILGFLARTLTTTPNERYQQRQRLYENGRRHKEERAKRYSEYTAALQIYATKKKSGEQLTLDDFQKVATTGDLYYNELKMSADAILARSVDDRSRETLVTDAAEAIQKTLPLHYETLQKIAKQIGCAYNGELKRQNYEAVYQVVEKYAPSSVMPVIASGTKHH